MNTKIAFIFLLSATIISAQFLNVNIYDKYRKKKMAVWESFPGQFPYYVHVLPQKLTPDDQMDANFGGVIISKLWIVTVASATVRAAQVKVLFGVQSLADTPKLTMSSKHWITYPKFDAKGQFWQINDICLIQLPRALVFNTFIKPINLDNMATRLYTGTEFVTCSYERNSWGSTNLQWTFMMGTEDSICQKQFSAVYTSKSLCTMPYPMRKHSKATCQWDGGSPLTLVTDDGISTLVGIAPSRINADCNTRSPKEFIRIGQYYDWIKRTMSIYSQPGQSLYMQALKPKTVKTTKVPATKTTETIKISSSENDIYSKEVEMPTKEIEESPTQSKEIYIPVIETELLKAESDFLKLDSNFLRNYASVPPTGKDPRTVVFDLISEETDMRTADTDMPASETELPNSETELPDTETELPTTETELPITETELPTPETEIAIIKTDFVITETDFPITETDGPITDEPTPMTDNPRTETDLPTTKRDLPTTVSVAPTTVTTELTKITQASTTDSTIATTVTKAPTTIKIAPTTVTDAPSTETEVSTTVKDVPTKVSNSPTTIMNVPTTETDTPSNVKDLPISESRKLAEDTVGLYKSNLEVPQFLSVENAADEPFFADDSYGVPLEPEHHHQVKRESPKEQYMRQRNKDVTASYQNGPAANQQAKLRQMYQPKGKKEKQNTLKKVLNDNVKRNKKPARTNNRGEYVFKTVNIGGAAMFAVTGIVNKQAKKTDIEMKKKDVELKDYGDAGSDYGASYNKNSDFESYTQRATYTLMVGGKPKKVNLNVDVKLMLNDKDRKFSVG